MTETKEKIVAIDYFGNIINIGDTAAFMQTGYRQLMIGTVIRLTDRMVILSHGRTNTGKTETKQEHNQIIIKK